MRRIGLAGVLAMLLTLSGFTVATSGALANSTIGGFEIDGNLADDSGAGDPIDWATPPPNQTTFTDPFNKQPDTVFVTGSKDNDPAGWDCADDGSAPGKDDIVRGKIAFRRFGGDLWAYVHYFRYAVNGDAHMDFEFHQSTAAASALCPELPRRTAGDIRIAFDTKNGGAVINVCPQTWSGTAFLPDTDTCAVANTLADGAVNIPPSRTIPGEKDGAFGEAAVNLTKTIGEIACGEFAGVYMKTRAATSADAALKDFTRSQPVATGECPSSTTTKQVRNATDSPGGLFSGSVDAKPGDLIDYKVTYSNAGPGVAHGVVVSDTIAAGSTYVAGSCSNSCSVSADGKTLTWNLGTVGVTSIPLTFQVQITGTFAPGTSTAIKNVAVTTTTEEGPKNSTETTVNVKTPSSSLTKAVRNVTAGGTFATTATARPGETLEYQIVYTNNGPGVASGVTVSDAIAAGSSYVAGSCTGGTGCSGTPTSVSWTLGDVPAGGSRTLTFRVLVDSSFPTPTAEIRNTAIGDSAQEPPTPSNETVVTVLANPTSSLDKSVRNVTAGQSTFANTTTANPGDVIEYQVVYSNAGPGNATNVVVTDAVATGSTYVANSCTGGVSCSGGTTVTWNLGTVNAGASRTLTFRVTLASSFPAGTTLVKNTAVVDTDQEPPKNSDETTVTVTANPVSSLDKSVRNVTAGQTTFANTTTATPGQVLEYQIVYSNTGNAAATNVVVTDQVATGSTYVANSCTGGVSCSGGTTVTWNLGTVAAGGTRTLTFRVTLASSFPAGTTLVKNTAVVDTDQEPPKNSDETTVTVTANPVSSLDKSVRNVTAGQTTFANTTTATPGQVLEYQIVYSNTGNAAATNVVVTDQVATGSTYVANSCTGGVSCSGGTTVTWNLGTVAAGGTRTLTFRVTLASSFPAGTTLVKNTAVVDTDQEPPDDSDETTVTVTATSNLTIVKAANKTTVVGGDSITYTLTYGNTGNGAATGTQIVETLPPGTDYVSCTGGCTVSGSTVTWSIGTVNPGGTGSVTLTVQVRPDVNTCSICNTAQIKSPVQNNNTAVNSNQVCVGASPSSDPSTAKANGDALGLKVYAPLLGIPLVNVEISKSSSTQTGPGQSADNDQFLSLDVLGVVGLASVARADVLRTTSSSQVTKATGARQTSTAEVLGLNVLSGVVTADVLRSVASTTATGTASSYSAAGTTATNLKVLGSSVANLTPGLKIPLDGNLLNRTLYGRGSYVAVNDQQGSTSGPASGQLSGGTYKADLAVTMVRVYITGGTIGTLLTLGGAPVEITIARATAHSEHKQTALCTSSPTKAVSGHAFIASAQVNPLLPTSTVEFVEIPASGGSAHKGVTASVLPADGSVVSTTDAAADTTGTNGATSSTASSYAQTAGACVLRVASPACLISATLIRSQANSSATSSARSSNATGTQFVNLVVAGIPIAGTPPPNTTIRLPLGLGYVVLNEQVPDGPETGHTGLTVRAVHALISTPLAPLLVGAEVIVAEAHSDATFR